MVENLSTVFTDAGVSRSVNVITAWSFTTTGEVQYRRHYSPPSMQPVRLDCGAEVMIKSRVQEQGAAETCDLMHVAPPSQLLVYIPRPLPPVPHLTGFRGCLLLCSLTLFM